MGRGRGCAGCCRCRRTVATRTHIARIWRRRLEGGVLDEGERFLVAAMERHPEYLAALSLGDDLGPRAIRIGGEDPFLHVLLHAAVEEQASRGSPAEVGAALRSLEAAGIDRDAAVHAVLLALRASAAGDPAGRVDFDGYRLRLRVLARAGRA